MKETKLKLVALRVGGASRYLGRFENLFVFLVGCSFIHIWSKSLTATLRRVCVNLQLGFFFS